MSQQVHNQEKLRVELADLIDKVCTNYEGSLQYWKSENNLPQYDAGEIEKHDFETLYDGSELKTQIDKIAKLSRILEFKNIDGTNQEFESRMENAFAELEMHPHDDPSVHIEQRETEHPCNEFDRNVITYSSQEWREFVERVYALGKIRSNASGSSHLHVSLKTQSMYSSLTNKRFFDTFCNFMYVFGKMYKTTNAEFFNRLCGNGQGGSSSSYWCKSVYDNNATRQGIATRGKITGVLRYRYVNYCYGLHSTVEIRGLPHFKKCSTMQDFDSVVFAFIETWVDKFEKEGLEILGENAKIKLHAKRKQEVRDESFTQMTETVL